MGSDLKLPLLTASLPGTGGVLKSEPEDFQVEELPSYEPEGQGPHLYLWVEKRALPARQALGRLSRVFGGRPNDVGQAGIKDTQAVTRQWFSVLDEAKRWTAQEALEADLGPELKILKAARHRNRLKTGHLRGNRFEVVIRGVGPDALERAEAKVQALIRKGVPNFYGAQRFGRDGQNVDVGLELLRDQKPLSGAARKVVRDKFRKRLIISAVQSWLYNQMLTRRLQEGHLHTVWDSDAMIKLTSGGRFVVEDAAAEQARFDAREIVHAGPIVGHKAPLSEGLPGELERAVLAEAGIEQADFKRFKKLALGTRRANLVYPGGLEVAADPNGLRLRFELPPGSYATVLLDEIIHPCVGEDNGQN